MLPVDWTAAARQIGRMDAAPQCRRYKSGAPASVRPLLVAAIGAILLAGNALAASEVAVPVRLDSGFLEQLLVETVFTDGDRTAEVLTDAHGCNRVVVSDPSVGTREDRIVLRMQASIRTGMWMGRCVQLYRWAGAITALQEPYVDAEAAVLRFRVVDSEVETASGGKGVSGRAWDVIKSRIHPRLEGLIVDLRSPVNEIARLLPLFLSEQDLTRTHLVLDSLRLANPRVSDDSLVVDLAVTLSEATATPVAPAPEPPLAADELAAWNLAWQRWDAFVTFAVVHLADEQRSEKQVRELRQVFLEARYDLAQALVEEPDRARDPVRRLFLRTWKRLRPLLREISIGLPGEAALRYLSLIGAGDALRAIDQLGPDVGVDISADGLRRLARLIDPQAAGDPLEYDTEVDPELRRMLGLGTPLPLPTAVATPDNDSAHLHRLFDWLFPPAFAAEPDADPEVGELSKRLRGWAPDATDAGLYLPLALRLLDLTGERGLAERPLAADFRPLFRPLLLAAAWQESCWRQYIRVGGSVQTITSAAGSLGVMQVNQHVWRGIYDVRGLRDDFAYNALAGTEILLHYLIDYAIRKGEHTATGNTENLARSTYAMYNGGPGHMRRYRKPYKSAHLREIDAAFWQKYREIRDGNDLAVRRCFQ